MTSLNFPTDTSSNYNAPNGLIYTYNSTKGVWLTTGKYSTGIIGADKLDDIDTTGTPFNGSNTTFTLKVNETTIHPESALSLYIVLAGVPQEPLVSYTINTQNGTITFSSAPESGTEFYGTVVSRLPFSGIPDGGVTNAKVAANAAIEGSKLQVASTNNAGAMSASDFSKLNGIDTSADVTTSTTVNAAGAVMNSDLDTKGEILVGDGSGDPTALSVGTNDHVLTADSSASTGVAWKAVSGGSGTDITIQDEGSALSTAAEIINFTGAGVTASGTGTTKTVNIPGGGSGITVQEEGSDLSTSTTTLNFVGSSVTATGAGSATKTITITDSGETNVQANWTESSDTSDAYIQNIPRKLSVDGSGNTEWTGDLYCDDGTGNKLKIGDATNNHLEIYTNEGNDGKDDVMMTASGHDLLITAKDDVYLRRHNASTSADDVHFQTTTDGVKINKGLQDSSGDLGSNGQMLYSTGTGINWAAAPGGGGGGGGSTTFTGLTDVNPSSLTNGKWFKVASGKVAETDLNWSDVGSKPTYFDVDANKVNTAFRRKSGDSADINLILGKAQNSDDTEFDSTKKLELYYDTANNRGVITATAPTPAGTDVNTLAIQHNGADRLKLYEVGTKWVGDLFCDAGIGNKLKIGPNAALTIYHDNSNSIIDDSGTGSLVINGSDIIIQKSGGNNHRMADFAPDGGNGCRLYHNNTNRLQTTDIGVTVDGRVTASEFKGDGSLLTSISYNDLDNKPVIFNGEYSNLNNKPQITLEGSDKTKWTGDLYVDSDTGSSGGKLKIGNDGTTHALQIYHDGSSNNQSEHNSIIDAGGTDDLLVYGTNIYFEKWNSNEYMAKFKADSSTELYWGGTNYGVRLTTTQAGATVSGTLTATAFSGNGSSLTNLPTVSYNDLSNKPTIPTNNNQLTNGAGYITSAAAVDQASVSAAFDDNDQLILGTGTGNDTLRLYYNGSKGLIVTNGSDKLEFQNAGVKWHGDLWCDDQDYIKIGDNADMTLRHDASGGSHYGVISVGNSSQFRLQSFNNIELMCGDGSGGLDWSVFGSANSWTALYYQGNMRFYTGSSGAVVMGHLIPNNNDLYDLGLSSYKWDDVYATNGTIQTSDRNEKNTIVDSDLGLPFVNKLKPVSYKYNGKTRTHYGLIAQDVETTLSDISKSTTEFAGFIKTDIPEELYTKDHPDVFNETKNIGDVKTAAHTSYGLRYGEFIAPLIKAVQELSTEVETLKTKVAQLEAG
mgnify:CR=1 FL=1